MEFDSLVGSAITLQCVVNKQGTEEIPAIFWSGPVHSQNITNSSNTLHLDPLMAANAGTYVCHASLESVTGSESINVTATCKLSQHL